MSVYLRLLCLLLCGLIVLSSPVYYVPHEMWVPYYYPGDLPLMDASEARDSLTEEKSALPADLSDQSYSKGGLDMDDEYFIPQLSNLAVEQEEEEEKEKQENDEYGSENNQDNQSDDVLMPFDDERHENGTDDDDYQTKNKIIAPVRFQTTTGYPKSRLLYGQVPTISLPIALPAQTQVPVSLPVSQQVLASPYSATSLGTHVYLPTQAVHTQIPIVVPQTVVPHTNQYGIQVPAIVQPQQPAIILPQHPAVIQPQQPAIIQPQIPTMTQPQIPTMTQPQIPTMTQPQIPTMVQPQSPPETTPTGRGEFPPMPPQQPFPTPPNVPFPGSTQQQNNQIFPGQQQQQQQQQQQNQQPPVIQQTQIIQPQPQQQQQQQQQQTQTSVVPTPTAVPQQPTPTLPQNTLITVRHVVMTPKIQVVVKKPKAKTRYIVKRYF
ncbi:unnamed protein product [Trichobilharzia szidati]|nr:unnamed protein product [Trichobilharzia szidati]